MGHPRSWRFALLKINVKGSGQECPLHTGFHFSKGQIPRPFGFAQGRLCLSKKRRDKDGAPASVEILMAAGSKSKATDRSVRPTRRFTLVKVKFPAPSASLRAGSVSPTKRRDKDGAPASVEILMAAGSTSKAADRSVRSTWSILNEWNSRFLARLRRARNDKVKVAPARFGLTT